MSITLRVVLVVLLVGLFGCGGKGVEDRTGQYTFPEELKECKVYILVPEGPSSNIRIVYCPGKTSASVKYNRGKITEETTTLTDSF